MEYRQTSMTLVTPAYQPTAEAEWASFCSTIPTEIIAANLPTVCSEISAWFEAHIRVIDNRETLEVLTERRETNRRDAIEAEAVGIAFQSVWLSL